MAKVIVVLKAILTRIIFGTHGFIAIWRVTMIKKDPYYWYLTASILALSFEGIFTLTIKKNQEWKWFCPSVFFYLCSVVPAIWLIELDKFYKKYYANQRMKAGEIAASNANLTAVTVTKESEFPAVPGLETLGVQIPKLDLSPETWITVIEQFLMLILIIGRWMLPKGGLTRDQLSQLLLVYIGTAADIIEFFDSFKDDNVSNEPILCLLILSIWSWSLLQFTFVLTATKARRTRLTTEVKEPPKLKIVNGIIKVKRVCCNIDVWAILINIILQDAPFLIFRALLILYYEIISYMNIFFTCKNTLVIILQFYRLYVVQQEKNKELSKIAKAAVSKNVANAVERASRMGPPNDGRARLVKNASSGRRHGKGPSSKQAQNRNKHRSQDSISSQNTERTNRSSSRRDRVNPNETKRERHGRRRSLSAGNLPEVGEGETFEDRIYEDDTELGMSGSALSGTNDPDSQEEDGESEVPLDDVSIVSERPRGPRKNIRMSENPGIYKISGSRSSGSSERGHGRYRQDTGYSSSSKDSGNSGGRRGRSHYNGRSGRPVSSRSRSSAQRRRQFISSKYNNSIEIGDYEGMLIDQLGAGIEEHDPMLDNERLWQRRVAIGVVFFLFVVIFILCLVALYGGISPKGLVLRENIRVRNTTRRTTTTPKPSTVVVITTVGNTKKTVSTILTGIVPAASVSPVGFDDADINSAVDGSNSTADFNDTMIITTEGNLNNISVVAEDSNYNENGSHLNAGVVGDGGSVPENDLSGELSGATDTNFTAVSNKISDETRDKSGFSLDNNYEGFWPPRQHHNVRHRMSRIFRFISEGDFYDDSGSRKRRRLRQDIPSF